MCVLVTGANGFVGRALCSHLMASGHVVVGAVRRQEAKLPRGVLTVVMGDVEGDSRWEGALHDVSAVIHLAARVHVMRDQAADPWTAFRQVNLDGTLSLARQAAKESVKRFIYISSIKVNGEEGNIPYSEATPPVPQDAYASSKWEAEQGLREIAAQTGLEVVILRPPLVYGPGVKANFLRLMRTIERGWPLPLGGINNRRSLLYLGNLVDAIQLCLTHPAAAGRTYLLSDGEDVSSPELVRRLARAMECPARLLPVPVAWLRLAGRLTGRRAEVDRLLGSLAVDSSLIRRELGWVPPFSLDAGLAETARDYFQSCMEAAPASR